MYRRKEKNMKQLTKQILKIQFTGQSVDSFEKVEFVFSQGIGEKPKKVCEYPSDSVIKLTDNALGVIWTPEETLLFNADKAFYMDTRIKLLDSEYHPQTSIVKLKMNPTLFEGSVGE